MSPNFDQGEFDFESGSERGYREWRQRLDEQKRAFESRWGVILGRRVRLQLAGFARPMEGVVSLVEDKRQDDRHGVRLRLGRVEFQSTEIESLVRADEEPRH